ncbi:hypothetical protein [Microbacterium sp. C448]|uniref:hypothetical protein n=1 Tax=Microbacterium sp. C448 TaxID=1177594 RepID=UPI001182124F|nr:hypothetical protein [Microbacterium sp. C448]
MQRPVPILVVAALAALLAGCAADPVAEPTPSPSFTSEAEAFAAAEATYRAYVDALNHVDLADPETFEAVYAWTTGDANAADRKLFAQMHADGEVVSGKSEVKTFAPTTVSDDSSVGADVCLDVSAVDVHNVDGVSIVSPDRVDVQSMRLQLVPSLSETGLAITSIVGRADGPPC